MIKRTPKQPRILTTNQLTSVGGGKALTLDLDVLLKAEAYKDNLTAWGASEIDLKV